MPICECYFESAKDKFLRYHHDFWEIKRIPGRPKNEQFMAYGSGNGGLMGKKGKWMGSRA